MHVTQHTLKFKFTKPQSEHHQRRFNQITVAGNGATVFLTEDRLDHPSSIKYDLRKKLNKNTVQKINSGKKSHKEKKQVRFKTCPCANRISSCDRSRLISEVIQSVVIDPVVTYHMYSTSRLQSVSSRVAALRVFKRGGKPPLFFIYIYKPTDYDGLYIQTTILPSK